MPHRYTSHMEVIIQHVEYTASNFLLYYYLQPRHQLWYGEPKMLVLNPVLDFFTMKLII